MTDLFNAITDEMAGQSGTEYDDDTEGGYADHMDMGDDEDDEGDDEGPDEDTPLPHTNGIVTREEHTRVIVPYDVSDEPPQPLYISREMLMSRERANLPIPRNGSNVSSSGQSSSNTNMVAGPSRRPRGFGHQPLIEASTSPTPSDAASNRSGGTNHSTGTGFFRHYSEMAPTSRAGVITPDLVFAEIGHGRGAGVIANGSNHNSVRRATDPVVVVPPPIHPPAYVNMQVDPPSFASSPSSRTLHGDEGDRIDDFGAVLADTSNSYLQHSTRTDSPWTHVQHESVSRSLSSSPTTRELQQSVQSVLGHRQFVDGREVDARGRSVKRSLRSTFTAAEQYASSFFFGRGQSGSAHDGPSTSHRDGR